jgi:predicted P-loop ATPase
LDPLCAALGKFDAASKPSSSSNLESGPTPLPKAPPPAKADKRTFLRQCIFIETTNDRHPLKDPTGNRRFAPFWATEIDLGGLKADRDQLMAEAYQLYKSATQWWPVGGEEELFRAEQEDRFNEDAWTDPLLSLSTRLDEG